MRRRFIPRYRPFLRWDPAGIEVYGDEPWCPGLTILCGVPAWSIEDVDMRDELGEVTT